MFDGNGFLIDANEKQGKKIVSFLNEKKYKLGCEEAECVNTFVAYTHTHTHQTS